MRRRAADACKTGILVFAKTEATMAASFREQPCCRTLINFTFQVNQKQSTYIQHWKDEPLEECAGFVQGPFQALVILGIKFFVLLNIFANNIQQHDAQKKLGLRWFHVRDEDFGCCATSMRGPIFGVSKGKHTRPHWKGGYYFKRFG